MSTPEDVLSFWLDEVGPEGWYLQDDALDAQIRKRFLKTWESARDGAYSMWLTYPSGALAYLIVTDQFSRNMFRDRREAFTMDRPALAVAKAAIGKGWDKKIDEPARQFFYLPLMHSECISDQEKCIRLLTTRMSEQGGTNLLHAKAHRDVIRKFGRFPFRNSALGRKSTPEEGAFLEDGGYGSIVRKLQAA